MNQLFLIDVYRSRHFNSKIKGKWPLGTKKDWCLSVLVAKTKGIIF
jgi:hypothetical protein